jgi:hypothetical protein
MEFGGEQAALAPDLGRRYHVPLATASCPEKYTTAPYYSMTNHAGVEISVEATEKSQPMSSSFLLITVLSPDITKRFRPPLPSCNTKSG